MNANDLNRRIAIYKFVKSTNAAGTPVETWVFQKWTWANIKVLGGDTQNADPEGNLPYTNVQITVRYDKEIDYYCQIKYNDQSYRITYINEDYRKNFYTLTCTTYNEYK